MAKYKITYERLEQRIMIVEADSKEEAKLKYQEFDCIQDHEDYGIEENLKRIELITD